MNLKRYKHQKGPRPPRNSIRKNGFQKSFEEKSSNRNKFINKNPAQALTKYLALAKNAASSGDTIKAEYYYQHVDHFSRLKTENDINKDKDGQINEIENKKNSNEEKNDVVFLKEKSSENKQYISNKEQEVDDDSLDSVSFLSEPLKKD